MTPETLPIPPEFYRGLRTFIGSLLTTRQLSQKVSRYKLKLCSELRLKKIPTDIELLLQATPSDYAFLKKYFLMKPGRTVTGVAPVAVMTSPAHCPHGRCTMCPGGVKSFFGDVPQSYTGKEPATRRAIRNNYDPYLQVFNRLEQYTVLGHLPQKVDVIIMGGTFPARTKLYQEEFVMYIFKAMNDFSRQFYTHGMLDIERFKRFFYLPGDINDEQRAKKIHERILTLKKGKTSLEAEQRKNEKSMIRCIGLTIETKPDWAKLAHGNEMLRLGCTRVELGVQTTDEESLRILNRGHSLQDSVASTAILKDLGFKINYHMMPGVPGSTVTSDIAMLKSLFEQQEYQPDMLKIYPMMIMPGTVMAEQHAQGKIKPMGTKEAVQVIGEFLAHAPQHVRVMRVQRDIPTNQTLAGVDRTNLRQYIDDYLRKKGLKSHDLREWEIKEVSSTIKTKDIAYHTDYYEASNGTEFFLYAEYNNQLLGYCRLRFPKQILREEITPDSALLRELHVVGGIAVLGKKGKVQHLGIGKKLMLLVEQICNTYYKTKIVVISGVGAREYYRKLGYVRQGPYMVKHVPPQRKSLPDHSQKKVPRKNKTKKNSVR